MLIVGTNRGTVRVYLWPLKDEKDRNDQILHSAQQQYFEYPVSTNAITKLCASKDLTYLFTASEDGSVFALEMRVVKNGQDIKSAKEPVNRFSRSQLAYNYDITGLNNLCLVEDSKLATYTSEISSLKEEKKQSKINYEYDLEKHDNEHKYQMEQLRGELMEQMETEQEKYALLQTQLDSERTEFLERLDVKQKRNESQVLDIEKKFTNSMNDEYLRYDRLKEEMEIMKSCYANELEHILVSHKEVISGVEDEYKSKFFQAQDAYSNLKNEMEKMERMQEEALHQTENEYEKEIIEINVTKQEEIDRQVKISGLYNKKYLKHKKKHHELKEHQVQTAKEHESIKTENEKNLEEIKRQKEDIEEYKRIIEEKDDTLRKKEEQFKELAAFNMHLQTFKSVLEHMIKSLNDERIPMDEQLNNLQAHIRDMYKDLLDEYMNRQEKQEQNKKSEARLKTLKKQNLNLSNTNIELKKRLNGIQTEIAILSKTAEYSDRKDPLWKHVLRIYERFVANDVEFNKTFSRAPGQLSLDGESGLTNELLHQKDRVQHKLVQIQNKNKRAEKELSDELLRKQKENAVLLKEINDLRDEKHHQKQIISSQSGQIKQLNYVIKSSGVAPVNRNASLPKKTLQPKETPYMQKKRNDKSDQDIYRPRLGKTFSQPQLSRKSTPKISSVIMELDRNREEILRQNTYMRNLQDQVSSFLMSSGPLPPINEPEKPTIATPSTQLGSQVASYGASPSMQPMGARSFSSTGLNYGQSDAIQEETKQHK